MLERVHADDTINRFEELLDLLDRIDIARIWDAATESERRALLDELLADVTVNPDRLTVNIHGAVALNVAFSEVGLKDSTLSGVGGGVLSQDIGNPSVAS